MKRLEHQKLYFSAVVDESQAAPQNIFFNKNPSKKYMKNFTGTQFMNKLSSLLFFGNIQTVLVRYRITFSTL